MLPEKKKKKSEILPVLRDYLRAALKYPWLFYFSIAGTIALETTHVIAPLYLSKFIDLLAVSTPSSDAVKGLLWILASFAGITLIGWAARRAQAFSIALLESRAMANLSNTAFDYLIRHSHDFFISNFVGTLSRRVNRYSRAFEQVFDSVILNFFPTFLFAVGVIVILYQKNAYIGLGLLGWTLFSVCLQFWLAGMVQPYRLKRSAEDSKVTGTLSDSISNHASVTLFANERHESTTFAEAIDRWRIATFRSWNIDQWVWSWQSLFAVIVEVGILAGSVFAWQAGYLTVGDFVLIQVYIIGLIDRLWGIGHNMRRLYEAFADASEMIDIFNTPHGIADAASAKPLSVSKGSVSFDTVSFWFDPLRPVLKELNLSIAGGEKVALVGPSGAGKSTITKLLLRLYDANSGSVRIDDQDIREVTQESLRTTVSFVPQEPTLFHRSLRENICYGKPAATEDEIMEAAKKAHCHEFISILPDGYDTHVGERGVKLSGGERQRVAIARAILKNAPILVLDEATSSLDSESEALIQDALRTLMEGKTVIVIAHRLSTIMRMDRIMVIEGGAIAASGTHNDLLNQEGGLYQKLWNIQAGGFLTGE